MSAVVREVAEHLQSQWRLLRGFHPMYASPSGGDAPCFPEYARLIECMNERPASTECAREYVALMDCFDRHGLR